ncbi:hypothetical protein J7E29_10150 [Streptomyces sp. ISL-90]|nr:hypothetical protein [Streptomyces sp. ISL-90]
MLISELNFPHIQAEREARLTRELEQRRVVLERIEEERSGGRVPPPKATRIQATHALLPRFASAWSFFRRTPRRTREAVGEHSEHPRAV